MGEQFPWGNAELRLACQLSEVKELCRLLFEGKNLSNSIEEPSKIQYLAIDTGLSSCTG